MVEENARPRAGLAVREYHVLFAEVREVVDSLRIAARDDDSLRPVEYEDAVPFSAVREALYENVVVAAGRFVEQMRRREVAFAARERREAAHAAERREAAHTTDGARGEVRAAPTDGRHEELYSGVVGALEERAAAVVDFARHP